MKDTLNDSTPVIEARDLNLVFQTGMEDLTAPRPVVRTGIPASGV